jgi:hypothetical protein
MLIKVEKGENFDVFLFVFDTNCCLFCLFVFGMKVALNNVGRQAM